MTRQPSPGCSLAAGLASGPAYHSSLVFRVLRKYLNQNPVLFEQFDTSKFRDLCKKQ